MGRRVHVKRDVPIVRFVDGVEFDAATGEVRRAGHAVRLEPQPAAVLAALVQRAGELVTHEELRRAVWGDATHVKIPDALHYCVRQIRHAVGDPARQPRYIETIPRRGYRLRTACVLPDAERGTGGSVPASVRPPALARQWGLRLAVAGAFLVFAAALEQRPNNHHQIAVTVLKSVHDLLF